MDSLPSKAMVSLWRDNFFASRGPALNAERQLIFRGIIILQTLKSEISERKPAIGLKSENHQEYWKRGRFPRLATDRREYGKHSRSIGAFPHQLLFEDSNLQIYSAGFYPMKNEFTDPVWKLRESKEWTGNKKSDLLETIRVFCNRSNFKTSLILSKWDRVYD